MTAEQAIEQAQAQLQAEKKEFRRLYDGLDKKTGAFDRLVKYRKRLDKDIEYFVRDLQKFKNISPLDKQLRVIQKKLENQQKLTHRIQEDFADSSFKSAS